MLIQKEVDLIFTIGYDFAQNKIEQIQTKLLGHTTHCACMKKTNPLATRNELSMEDLKQSHFISISPHHLPEYTKMLHELCEPFGYTPNIISYVSSANSLTLNLQEDQDIFICDQYYADLNDAEHVKIPIKDTSSGFIVAWHEDKEKPYIRYLIDLISDL